MRFYDNASLLAVVRHELGHEVGLAPEELLLVSTMAGYYYSFGMGCQARLHGDDRNAVRTFYPNSSQPPLDGWETDLQLIGWKMNNSGSAATWLVPVAKPSPAVIEGSRYINTEFTIENLGTQSVPFATLHFYLSRNSTIDTFDRQLLVTSAFTPDPAIGGPTSVPVRLDGRQLYVPCDADTGLFYVTRDGTAQPSTTVSRLLGPITTTLLRLTHMGSACPPIRRPGSSSPLRCRLRLTSLPRRTAAMVFSSHGSGQKERQGLISST